jgi:hypothetical protein
MPNWAIWIGYLLQVLLLMNVYSMSITLVRKLKVNFCEPDWLKDTGHLCPIGLKVPKHLE